MKANMQDFLVTGRIGTIEVGSATRQHILGELGEPDIDQPQRKSYPEFLVYKGIEFRLRDGVLQGIALNLRRELPETVEFDPFPAETLQKARIEALLQANDESWKQDELFSQPEGPVFVTSRKVQLVFDGETLVRAVATTMERWPTPDKPAKPKQSKRW